jgi:hypothetical protein
MKTKTCAVISPVTIDCCEALGSSRSETRSQRRRRIKEELKKKNNPNKK